MPDLFHATRDDLIWLGRYHADRSGQTYRLITAVRAICPWSVFRSEQVWLLPDAIYPASARGNQNCQQD